MSCPGAHTLKLRASPKTTPPETGTSPVLASCYGASAADWAATDQGAEVSRRRAITRWSIWSSASAV